MPTSNHVVMKPLVIAITTIAIVAVFIVPACSHDEDQLKGENQKQSVVVKIDDYPQTLQVGRLSIGCPEGFIAGESNSYEESTAGKTFLRETAVLHNDDYSIAFTVEEYHGVDYGEAWKYAEAEPGLTLSAAEEVERKWGKSASTTENTVWEDPRRILLNGNEAFVCEWSLSSMGKTSHAFRYCVFIDEDTIGVVTGSYTDDQYAMDSKLFDGVFSSIEVN